MTRESKLPRRLPSGWIYAVIKLISCVHKIYMYEYIQAFSLVGFPFGRFCKNSMSD